MKTELCQRCFTGIDDNRDGNCAFCARLSEADLVKVLQSKLQSEFPARDAICQRESCGKKWIEHGGEHGPELCPDGMGVFLQSKKPNAIDLARRFHTLYEALAPQFGYETRKESAKPWSQVPEQNKNLMTAVCAQIIEDFWHGGNQL